MSSRNIERTVVNLIRVAIVLIVVVTVVFIGKSHSVRLVRGLFDVLTGRTICSFSQIQEGEEYLKKRLNAAETIFKRIHLVETVAGTDHWRTPYGDFWTPRRLGKANLAILLAEQESNLYGSHTVRRGDVVLDCGANVGVFTRMALRNGARLVVAIEPAPDVVDSLTETFSAETRDGRVIVYGKGVWDKDDFLVLKESEDSVGDSFVVDSGVRHPSDRKLPLTTIDKIVAELKLPRVDLIKMDVEGAERQALKGAGATIRKFKPKLAIAAEHLADDPVVIPQLVQSLHRGYSVDCGPCYRMSYHDKISPDVLYFH